MPSPSWLAEIEISEKVSASKNSNKKQKTYVLRSSPLGALLIVILAATIFCIVLLKAIRIFASS